jgi:hypothetical protein
MADSGAHPIWAVLDDAERQLEAARASLSNLRRELAKCDLPQHVELKCPECGTRLTSWPAYSDHLYNKHQIDLLGEGGGPQSNT